MARRSSAFTCAALLVVLLPNALMAVEASARQLLRQPDTNAVPQECISTGLGLQTACTAELELASKALGVKPGADVSKIKVDPQVVKAYLAKAPAPSAACCTAAGAFNNAMCSCSPPVLELVVAFTGNDIASYREVASYLATRCKEVNQGYTLFMDATCPNTTSAKKP